MTPFAQALSQALLHFIWQGIAVGILLWSALILLRKRSASARYAASCLALAALAALPPFTVCFVYAHIAPVSISSAPPAGPATAMAIHAASQTAPRAANWLVRIQSWALPVWSIGVLLLSIRLLWGARQVYRLKRRGSKGGEGILASVAAIAARMEIVRRVDVLISALADGPTVVGWIRPVILLPASTMIGLTPEQLEAVLAHELAHIRRHDYLVNLMQMVVETVLFYHPVVWWASSCIRQERELCCDDLAVRACGDALCYARALTILERMRIATPEVAMGGAGGPLHYRILRLLGASNEERGSSRLAGVLALCLAIVCFGLNTHWARGQQPVSRQPGETFRGRFDFVMGDTARREAERGITVDANGAQILHRNAAEYPESAMDKGIQGTVVVETTLDAAGNVVDAHVISGPTELRKAALQSALTAHFVNQSAGSTRQLSFTFTAGAASHVERAPERGVAVTGQATFGPDSPAAYSPRQAEEEAVRIKQMQELKAQLARMQSQVEQAGQAQELSGVQSDQLLRSQKQVEKLAAELQAAQQLYRSDMPETKRIEESLAFAQQELQRREAEMNSTQAANEEQTAALADLQKKLAAEQEVKTQMRAVQEQLSAAEADISAKSRAEANAAREGLAGRTVTELAVNGLPDSLRSDLLAKLPVHPGDVLTPDSISQLKKTIRDFDEHLQINFSPTASGGITISISTPGSGRVFVFNK